MSIEDVIIRFITEEFAYDRDVPQVHPEQSLLDSGLIDSVGILRLAAFIEEKFNIVVQDEDLVPENFASARAVAEFVQSKTAARE